MERSDETRPSSASEESNGENRRAAGDGQPLPPRQPLPSIPDSDGRPPPSKDHQANKEEQPNRLHQKLISSLRASWLTTNRIIAVAACVQAIVAWFQWNAVIDANRIASRSLETSRAAADSARKSGDAADLALKIVQRPYIIMGLPQRVQLSGTTLQLPITYINGGSTAARNVKLFSDYTLSLNSDAYPDYASATAVRNQADRMSHYPKSLGQMTIIVSEVDAGKLRDKVTGGADRMLIYGKVEYDDDFKDHHWIHFCTEYEVTRDLISVSARNCPSWNDSD